MINLTKKNNPIDKKDNNGMYLNPSLGFPLDIDPRTNDPIIDVVNKETTIKKITNSGVIAILDNWIGKLIC